MASRRYDSMIGQEVFLYRYNHDEVYRVSILRANGNESFEGWKLKILNIIKESPIFIPLKEGQRINFKKARGNSNLSLCLID